MIRQSRKRRRYRNIRTYRTAHVSDGETAAGDKPAQGTDDTHAHTSTDEAHSADRLFFRREGSQQLSSVSVSQSSSTSPKRFRSHSTRSVSPARFYREREQSELQNLNERLSSHVDTVKSLQAENASLKMQLQGIEVSRLQVTNSSDKEAYQEMLDIARQENMKLETALRGAKKDRESLQQSLDEREKDIMTKEMKIKDLQKVSKLSDKQKADIKALKEVLIEKEEAAKRLSDDLIEEKIAKKRLEEEVLKNEARYASDLEEAKKRVREHLKTTDQKLEAGYEELVNDALTSVREQNVRDIAALKEELTTLYQTKLNEWKTKAERSSADLLSTRKELKASKTDIDKLRTQKTRLKMEVAALKVQIEEDQKKCEELKSESEKEVCQLQREMVLLKQELSEVKDELEEMGGANMRMEQQITTYRVLLEDLESKSPFTRPPEGHKNHSGGGDDNSVAVREDNFQEHRQCADLLHKSNEIDRGIQVEDVDTNGRYMIVVNKTDHLIDMCLWTVHQSIDDQMVKFEIPYSTPLTADQRLLIWSEGAGPFLDKPRADDILSLPDDHDTREFYGILTRQQTRLDDSCSTTNDSAVTAPRQEAIHISMQQGKHWARMNVDDTMEVRLEDGDGQLQTKCDFILLKHGELPLIGGVERQGNRGIATATIHNNKIVNRLPKMNYDGDDDDRRKDDSGDDEQIRKRLRCRKNRNVAKSRSACMVRGGEKDLMVKDGCLVM